MQKHFDIVLEKIKNGDYRIKKSKEFRGKKIDIKSPYLEAINYFMFEYMKDRKDWRVKDLFDYIVVPNDVDKLFDFNTIEFEDFFKFLIDIKEK